MQKILICLLIMVLFSCKKNDDYVTLDVKYNKSDSVISIIYTNNTNQNLFFLNPNFSICKLKLNEDNKYTSSSVYPCIIDYSLIKDSPPNYNVFQSIIEEHYLKYFNKNQIKESLKILNEQNEIIILKKNETYKQSIKIKTLSPPGVYEIDFLRVDEYLYNLKTQKDPLYNFFKSFDNLFYKNYKYYNKDFIIENNRFDL